MTELLEISRKLFSLWQRPAPNKETKQKTINFLNEAFLQNYLTKDLFDRGVEIVNTYDYQIKEHVLISRELRFMIHSIDFSKLILLKQIYEQNKPKKYTTNDVYNEFWKICPKPFEVYFLTGKIELTCPIETLSVCPKFREKLQNILIMMNKKDELIITFSTKSLITLF